MVTVLFYFVLIAEMFLLPIMGCLVYLNKIPESKFKYICLPLGIVFIAGAFVCKYLGFLTVGILQLISGIAWSCMYILYSK